MDVRRTLPDGTELRASFERRWQAGPVKAHAEYDPATGRWVVTWESDVNLDAALQADLARTEAMTRAFEAGIKAAAAAAGGGVP